MVVQRVRLASQGEDPYLGAKLTAEYVKGVQEMGVATVTKHYVFNNQETNRNTENSIVDDKTAWELYYPPFKAAVDAGGVGFMCSCTKSRKLFVCAPNLVGSFDTAFV